MKVIIAGSRENINYEDVVKAIEQSNFIISTVVSGTARGVDRFGEKYARANNLNVEQYPAEWDK